MDREVVCIECEYVFEVSEAEWGGECPVCNRSFVWNWDCDDEWDAILIPHWD